LNDFATAKGGGEGPPELLRVPQGLAVPHVAAPRSQMESQAQLHPPWRWWQWLRCGHSDGQRSEGPPELFRVPQGLAVPHVAAPRSQMESQAQLHPPAPAPEHIHRLGDLPFDGLCQMLGT